MTNERRAQRLAEAAARYFDNEGDAEFIESFTKDALIVMEFAFRDGWMVGRKSAAKDLVTVTSLDSLNRAPPMMEEPTLSEDEYEAMKTATMSGNAPEVKS